MNHQSHIETFQKQICFTQPSKIFSPLIAIDFRLISYFKENYQGIWILKVLKNLKREQK
jgi:hypothetical protein